MSVSINCYSRLRAAADFNGFVHAWQFFLFTFRITGTHFPNISGIIAKGGYPMLLYFTIST